MLSPKNFDLSAEMEVEKIFRDEAFDPQLKAQRELRDLEETKKYELLAKERNAKLAMKKDINEIMLEQIAMMKDQANKAFIEFKEELQKFKSTSESSDSSALSALINELKVDRDHAREEARTAREDARTAREEIKSLRIELASLNNKLLDLLNDPSALIKTPKAKDLIPQAIALAEAKAEAKMWVLMGLKKSQI